MVGPPAHQLREPGFVAFVNSEYQTRLPRWRLRAGGTIFVRDAKIELSQGALQASDSNIGVVPLINFTAKFYPAKKWRIVAEIDGLAAPQGRAFDNDEVYNFAWFQSLVVSLGLRF